MDPTKIQADLSLKNKQPKTVGVVRHLLGLLEYYRRYIQDFPELQNLYSIFCNDQMNLVTSRKHPKHRRPKLFHGQTNIVRS